MAKEKKEQKNLDDFLDDIRKTSSKSLDESFKAYDQFNKEENINHWYNDVFAPAQDSLYQTIKAELDKTIESDDASLQGKKKEIRKAVSEGLKKYFEKAQPSVTKAITGLGLTGDEQYEFLTSTYDEHVGAGKMKGVDSIKSLEGLAKSKKATVGHLKRHLHSQKSKQVEAALNMLLGQHLTHHFSKYRPFEIAAYLKPKIEREGYEIADKLGFITSDLGELLELRKSIVEKEAHPYLKRKKEKK